LQSGTPLVKGLEITSAGVRDPLWKNALAEIKDQIRDGGSFSRAVKGTRVFPPMALHLAAVGEETGHLEATLQKTADLLDAEAKRNIKEKMALLEPVMVLAMAGVVALLIFTVLVPILTFTSQLQI
jgi:general secretion pathway protein F